ncbi:MAG TPA: alkaline phosphatase family protein [Lacunisphaera sp.]|nr:alkaline phosphatase family protein [Lacunisphaera sp.]
MKFITLVLAASLSVSGFAAHADRHVVVISLDGFPAYLWREPDLPIPNLRKLAAEGAVADAMTVTTPASTWSSHTSMITSRAPRQHGVFFNGQVVLPGPGKMPYIEQWADKDGFVLVPTLYDLVHGAGLTVAESDWVAITRAKTVNWSFFEIPSVDGPVEKEMMAAGLLTAEEIGWMQHKPGRKSIVYHDQVWARAAAFMFEKHRPNLLLFHPLTTDSVHHAYGPGNDASYAALAHADRLVGDVVAAVERSGLRDRTTFIVMTDHGFKKVNKYIHANVALVQAGLARAQGPGLVDCQAAVLSAGGTALVYITDPARRAELLPKVRAALSGLEGIAEVAEGEAVHALGLPTSAENPRAGDLVLVAKDGYLFNNSAAPGQVIMPVGAYGATHGYAHRDPDMDGIFVASGAHVKKGVKLDRVRNLDLAPTIARILGLDALPGAEGRVLEEILR